MKSVPWKPVLLFLLMTCTVSWCQQAPVTRQQTLSELTREAQTIVRGRVVSAVVENHPRLRHLRTVVVTISVSDTLKGAASQDFTFRQLLWNMRAASVPDIYRPGGEVLLMMIAPSEYGLSSPAGLEQGAFRITQSASGEALAVNGRGNIGLFANVVSDLKQRNIAVPTHALAVAQAQQGGPVAVKDLSQLIRGLVGGK
jgi:hypothetical protein